MIMFHVKLQGCNLNSTGLGHHPTNEKLRVKQFVSVFLRYGVDWKGDVRSMVQIYQLSFVVVYLFLAVGLGLYKSVF